MSNLTSLSTKAWRTTEKQDAFIFEWWAETEVQGLQHGGNPKHRVSGLIRILTMPSYYLTDRSTIMIMLFSCYWHSFGGRKNKKWGHRGHKLFKVESFKVIMSSHRRASILCSLLFYWQKQKTIVSHKTSKIKKYILYNFLFCLTKKTQK